MNAKWPQSRMVTGFCGLFHVLMKSVIFGEMVPKWCPTLQKHVIRSLDTIFRGIEKMPISCGFAGPSYEKSRRLLPGYFGIRQ